MPVVLDTDHLSVLQWHERPACDRLLARLDALAPDDIGTTLISFQEQVEGWLAYLKRARKGAGVVHAYAKLEEVWRSCLKMNVLSFTDEAQQRVAEVRRQCTRLQPMNLRIARVALVTS